MGGGGGGFGGGGGGWGGGGFCPGGGKRGRNDVAGKKWKNARMARLEFGAEREGWSEGEGREKAAGEKRAIARLRARIGRRLIGRVEEKTRYATWIKIGSSHGVVVGVPG